MNFQMFKDEVSRHFRLSLNSYKETQLKRRIDNIMARHKALNYQEYLRILQMDKEIYNEFIDYITINVSEFFRNPEMFKVLEQQILPDLAKKNKRLKIWSAACSIGAEPYSIAMILSDLGKSISYQIEATDIDPTILNFAKQGSYKQDQLKNISAERIKKYFTQADSHYHISQDLKRNINFRRHDLLLDAYQAGYNLIVCRNVTIYFTKESQDKIYRGFSESLNQGGYLFIGGTENIFNYKILGLEKVSTSFYRKL